MTPPKIKWRVEKATYAYDWYTIIAEVELGSWRYQEVFSVSEWRVDKHYNAVLWKIIEKMQLSMLDALGYYDFNPPVSYDFQRIQASVNSGTIVVPYGLSRLERREWVHNNKGKLNGC